MLRLRSRMTEERPPEVVVREWRNIGRESHADMGEQWRDEMLAPHFRAGNVQRYRLQARSRKYRERKARMHRAGQAAADGRTALVFSGDLATAVLATATVRGFPSRATIAMTGPNYFRIRPKSGQPDLGAEVSKVTRDEETTLTATLDRSIEDRLARLRQPTTTVQ